MDEMRVWPTRIIPPTEVYFFVIPDGAILTEALTPIVTENNNFLVVESS